MEIRRAIPGDAEAIRTIYNIEVTETTATFDLVERSVSENEAFMRAHQGVYPIVVAIEGHEVLGFACLSPYRARPAYATTAENSIYVAEANRGQGVGKKMLTELIEMATAHGLHSVIARIVADRPASIALHRSCGFELVGIEREIGRKFGRWLDVALMQRMLSVGISRPTGST